jgi:hypothetical protein
MHERTWLKKGQNPLVGISNMCTQRIVHSSCCSACSYLAGKVSGARIGSAGVYCGKLIREGCTVPTVLSILSLGQAIVPRVSVKQSNFLFGSNRNKPKLNLFRFRETQKKFLVCFSSFRCFGPVSKQPKQTELYPNKPKKSPENVLYWGSSKKFFLFLGSNRKKPKLNLFGCFSLFFAKPTKIFFF